jgi:hypothetical protein
MSARQQELMEMATTCVQPVSPVHLVETANLGFSGAHEA